MNGWVLSIAAVLVLVVAFRAWFRWFSRRPLSTVDHYARGVDTSVDSVDGGAPTGPTLPATGAVPPFPAGPPRIAVPPFADAPLFPAGAPRPALPQQRSAAQAADDAPHRTTPVPRRQR